MKSIFKAAEDAKRKLEEAMRNYETEADESEAADEEEQDAKNEIIQALKPDEVKLAAWVFQQPLSSDYDMIRNIYYNEWCGLRVPIPYHTIDVLRMLYGPEWWKWSETEELNINDPVIKKN